MARESKAGIFTLPLFPLKSVLFPHLPVHLHIFEERYQAMINGCIERHAPFGVVLIKEGEETGAPAVPHDVGCIAHILGVERLEDGRMNLVAAGDRRFRLLEYMEADLPYLVGRVEEIEDVPVAQPEVECAAQEVSELLIRYLTMLAERVDQQIPSLELPQDAETLSFWVASVATIPDPDKQALLEMTSTSDRLRAESLWLADQIAACADAPGAKHRGVQVLVARPLDLESMHWLDFAKSVRN